MTPGETFAISTDTFDCEYLLQISRGTDVLITVGVPAGGASFGLHPHEFCVWEGDGVVLEVGEEKEPIRSFPVTPDNIAEQWKRAVEIGYSMALQAISLSLGVNAQ
jgi:hypothetical protein